MKVLRLEWWLKRFAPPGENGHVGWTRALLISLWRTFRGETLMASAAIAFFALFSLFPLVILTVDLAVFGFGEALVTPILRQVAFSAPVVIDLFGDNLSQVVARRGRDTWLAIGALIWSASTSFAMITRALNLAWGTRSRYTAWHLRLVAVALAILFSATLLLLSFGSTFVAAFWSWITAQTVGRYLAPLGVPLAGALGAALSVALFALLYRFLPYNRPTWHAILPGAVLAALLWEASKYAFAALLRTYLTVSNLVYGSVTAIIAFLLWAYISSLILMFGAYFSACRHRPAATAGSPATQETRTGNNHA